MGFVLAVGGEKLAADGLEEAAPPKADEQQSPEKQHGVEAGAVPGPVNAFPHVQPDRELVQMASASPRTNRSWSAIPSSPW